MSEKLALSEAVAENVRRWRLARGLDQQGLADRLAELGWGADRTTVTRIEKGTRKVTVDELGVLALAVNIPLPLLLLPVHDGTPVTLTPDGPMEPVNPWLLWDWMRGETQLPGEPERWRTVGAWVDGARILWHYDALRGAQARLHDLERYSERGDAWVDALQDAVNAVDDLASEGIDTTGLLTDEWAKEIEERGIKPISPADRARAALHAAMRAARQAAEDAGRADGEH